MPPAGAGARGDVFSQEVALALYTGAAGRAPSVEDILSERLLAHPAYRTQGRGVFPSAPLPYRGLAGPPLPPPRSLPEALDAAAAAAEGPDATAPAAGQRQNPSQRSENMRKLLAGEETRQCLVRGRKRCGPGRGEGEGEEEGPLREETPFARAQVPFGAPWRPEREGGAQTDGYYNRKVSEKVGADGPLDADVYVENIKTMKTVKPKKPLTAGQLLPASRSGRTSRGGTGAPGSRSGTARTAATSSSRGGSRGRSAARPGTGAGARSKADAGTYILDVRPGTGQSRPGTGQSRPGTGAGRSGVWAGTHPEGPAQGRGAAGGAEGAAAVAAAASALGLAGVGGGSRPGTAVARAERQAAEWRKKSGAVANKLEALLEGDAQRLTQKVGAGGAFSSQVYSENLRTQKTIKPQKTKTISPVPPPAA